MADRGYGVDGGRFVSREQQLAILQQRLEAALSGKGQVCFVVGQAGSGKTALVRHFVDQAFARHDDVVLAVGTGNAQTGAGDPFLPFREALAMLTGDTSGRGKAAGDSPENTRRLRTVLVRSVEVMVEVAPDLLGVFLPFGKLFGEFGKAIADKAGWLDRLEGLAKKKELAAAGAGSQAALQAEQARIFEQFTRFVQEMSAAAPLILFLDDLQWADSASINLFFHLARHVEEHRVLLIGSYRANDVALGRDGGRHPLEPVVNELTRYYGDVTIDLDALPVKANRRFVTALLDAEPNCLGEDFYEALFARTGGHALFTVELLRAMKERGSLVRDHDGCWVEGPRLDWEALPARVEGVIEERIERLGEELKELLQVASVEGEQFTAEVVARVQGLPERQAIRRFSHDLDRQHRLVNDHGVVRWGAVHLSLYRFVHNLFQHYLYQSLSAAERMYLHRDVGREMEALLGDQTEEVAAQLARHFEEAGVPGRAAFYRLKAANRARRMSAHQEAVGHLTHGLELASTLPPGPERMQLEFGLQTALGTVLISVHGYASPGVDRAFLRARELARALGDPPEALHVLLGQVMFYLMRGQTDQAWQEGEHLLELAERVENAEQATAYRLTIHVMLGVTALFRGDYPHAQTHLEATVSLYDVDRHRDLAYQQGQDPAVAAHAFLSRLLWLRGHPEQALARAKQAVALAAALEHPYSMTLASLHLATLYSYLRRWPECQAEASRALRLARDGGFKMWEANAGILSGASVANLGRPEEGLDEIVRSLFLWEATGAGLVAFGATNLATAYCLLGRRKEGLRAIDESLYRSQEKWWEPEQLRVRAELLLLEQGDESEAATTLRHAHDLAREQGATALALRTATSLAALHERHGLAPDAVGLLAACYADFREGLDSADLVAARRLLETSSPGSNPVLSVE
jgi:predicted ATPase